MRNLSVITFILIFVPLFYAKTSAFEGFSNQKPSHEEDVGSVADKLFEAMRLRDADGIRTLFLDGGQVTSVQKFRSGDGLSTRRTYSAEEFVKLITSTSGNEMIEKMPEKEVRIYGYGAVITGRYTFHVSEKFSHCGTNAFHLLQTENGWKIANVTTTVEFTKCDSKVTRSAAEEKQVSTVIDRLFDAMTEHKPIEIMDLHTPESQLIAFTNDRDGKKRIDNLTRKAFSKFFETKRAEIQERMYDRKVRIFGDMALVDGRYVFSSNGKIVHCGMNSFHLIQTSDGWKIGDSISTIEPNGCTEREKGMQGKASGKEVRR